MAALAGLVAPGAALAGSRPASRTFDPADADASDMATALEKGHISAAALVEQSLKRLETVNSRLNAVHYLYADSARAAARTANDGPLAGIPTFIKDLAAEKGRVASHGSRAYAQNIAQSDSPVVTAIRAAGLISLGHTTVSEFGLLPTTEPLLTGPTRNPWNPAHSAGGSSGGAAALVAAGVVPVAHASDGGGSIRIPASNNGLVGLKPSRARMRGEEEHKGIKALSVNGCLSRTVRDTAAWFAACESRNGPLAAVGLVSAPLERRLRIGFRKSTVTGVSVDPEVQRVFQEGVALMERLGHQLVKAPLPFDGAAATNAFLLLWGADAAEALQNTAKFLGRQPTTDDLEPATFGFAGLAANAEQADFKAAAEELQNMSVRYLAQYTEFDVLLTPVLAVPPPPIGHLAPTVAFPTLRGRLLDAVGYTPVENIAGNPAISLPLGMSENGLPIGLQFAAPIGAEKLLLELAYSLEAEVLWGRKRPAIRAA